MNFCCRFSLFSRHLLWASLLLGACGGGSGAQEGSGQAPDPVTVDLPLAYIERPIPVEEQNPEVLRATDIFEPAAFNPGAEVYLKPRATALAAAENISRSAFSDDDNFTPEAPNYDVKDLSIHPAGDRLLFAMRAPEIPNADDDDQPTWNIWEYHLHTRELRRIISSAIIAEAGDDVSPRYLPDDRIVFSSSRQTRSRALLLDDNKPQYTALVENAEGPAFVLHVMDSDGANIQQITYNQSHDLQPSVMDNGRILFTRWDLASGNHLSLYTVNPDGTDLQYHYGFNSLNPEPPAQDTTLFRPQQLPDGRIAAIFKSRSAFQGGDLLAIDSENFIENTQPIHGSGGEAQSALYHLEITLDDEASRNGLFSSLSPLFDGTNRLLISWSQCRLEEIASERLLPCNDQWWGSDEVRLAPPLFGIWLYNLNEQTQQPVILGKEGRMFTEAVALEPRIAPAYIAPVTTMDELGTLHIRSVYDGNLAGVNKDALNLSALANPLLTPADQRPARFVRIVKAVSIADGDVLDEQDDAVYGNRFNQNSRLREIIGYTPVEPDGSVLVQVPADIAFTLEVLDAQGKRISTNATFWMQIRPGEQRECDGCLASSATQPLGRAEAVPESINPGAAGGVAFPGSARFDEFGTPELPVAGETMAQLAARTCYTQPAPQIGEADLIICPGTRTPSVDIIYVDEWTDPITGIGDEAFAFRYRDLITGDQEQSVARAPLKNKGCLETWSSTCRIVINYENHIAHLWERERLVDVDPDPALITLEDRHCSGCHTRTDANVEPAVQQIPPGQLELINAPATGGQMTSYRELLFGDVELELVDGSLTPRQIETGRCQVDIDGNEIRDENGICTAPVLTTVAVRASMSGGGARASARFFNRFAQFDALNDTVDHRGWLNPSELKLLSEWLDLGGRYYNNPFDSAEQQQDQ